MGQISEAAYKLEHRNPGPLTPVSSRFLPSQSTIVTAHSLLLLFCFCSTIVRWALQMLSALQSLQSPSIIVGDFSHYSIWIRSDFSAATGQIWCGRSWPMSALYARPGGTLLRGRCYTQRTRVGGRPSTSAIVMPKQTAFGGGCFMN
jgi:hypothetical protein